VGVHDFEAIDWERWSARDLATLVFGVRDERLLLIHKKRGLGAGKINAPGGRLEDGETPRECAVREVIEEVGVRPLELEWVGENRFQFVDGYSIHVYVFVASGCEGEPVETDEAIPLWADVAEIPFERMWEDDRLWVPLVLERRRFSGRYLFDGDAMLGYSLEVGEG
jgi:8-oxo-dGTP diphosphatase